jgi:hypothetical protein
VAKSDRNGLRRQKLEIKRAKIEETALGDVETLNRNGKGRGLHDFRAFLNVKN